MSLEVEGSSSTPKQLPALKMLDCTLRVSAIPLSIASIWLTVTDHQSNETFGKIEFHNLLGLKYMVLISAICAAYAFTSAASSWLRVLAIKAWIFFLSDQVIAYLMVTSVAAVSEIVYLGYKGDREVTWSEACSSFGKFCSRMGIGLVFHALALCCFLSLSVISAFRAFSVFDPPCVSSKEEEEDRRDN
ncbi:hypothetical protein CDL15_Pgr002539 [Punica granatum]|uniref:CASP-like protein n=1 Tax=Punica granatum TaxID=22663 RepID=A0A218XWV6_PUNGR|nr:hypothetical protein CDL15_Pgr002539 [Punica granatum]